MHNIFLDHNQILRDTYRITNIPGIIVHGRYDVVCPVENAFELHRAWPKSQLRILPDAGHAAGEPSIADALLKATAEIASLLTHGQSN